MKYVRAYDYDIGYLMHCEGMTEQEAKGRAISTELFARVAYRACERRGHKIVDESYGNPESGVIAMSCIRCGWACHHILY